MDKQTILALKLKDYRDKNGLTQAQLAEQLEVSDKTISKWENGETYPSKRNMLAISEKLHFSLEALMIEETQVKTDYRKLSFKYTFYAYLAIFFVSMLILSSRYAANSLGDYNIEERLRAVLDMSLRSNCYAIPAAICIGLVFYYYIFPKQNVEDEVSV